MSGDDYFDYVSKKVEKKPIELLTMQTNVLISTHNTLIDIRKKLNNISRVASFIGIILSLGLILGGFTIILGPPGF